MTKENLVRTIKEGKGKESVRIWREEHPNDQLDLSGEDLRQVMLHGADLRHGIFRGTKFYKTDLSGALLNEADLSRTDLGNADLTNADLSQADLTEALVVGTQFNGSNMRGAVGIQTLTGIEKAAWGRAKGLCIKDKGFILAHLSESWFISDER